MSGSLLFVKRQKAHVTCRGLGRSCLFPCRSHRCSPPSCGTAGSHGTRLANRCEEIRLISNLLLNLLQDGICGREIYERHTLDAEKENADPIRPLYLL